VLPKKADLIEAQSKTVVSRHWVDGGWGVWKYTKFHLGRKNEGWDVF
jgi:hypothetical protein